jgi:hypothetical protein
MTLITFHDTPLFYLLILLVRISKFNVHNTLMTLPLKLTLITAEAATALPSLELELPPPPIVKPMSRHPKRP